MRSQHAQAAIEFLTTYGWAFLVLLIMAGGLNYFGVLNPTHFLPTTCVFTQGISCTDTAILSDGTVIITLKNNLGTDFVLMNAGNRSMSSDIANQGCYNGINVMTSFTGLNDSGLINPITPRFTAGVAWNATQPMYLELMDSTCGVLNTSRVKIYYSFVGTALGKSYPRTIEGTITINR